MFIKHKFAKSLKNLRIMMYKQQSENMAADKVSLVKQRVKNTLELVLEPELVLLLGAVNDGDMEMVQVTPLMRTLASSP